MSLAKQILLSSVRNYKVYKRVSLEKFQWLSPVDGELFVLGFQPPRTNSSPSKAMDIFSENIFLYPPFS